MCRKNIRQTHLRRRIPDIPPGSTWKYMLWHIYSGILADILSGTYLDILSEILSGIYCGIYSDMLSGIHSGICCDILADILFGILPGIYSHLSGILTGVWLRSGH